MSQPSQLKATVPFPPGYRASGVLLHPTSLPSPYGIGDLGPSAFAWVDALVRAGQSWWQVLPTGPTGYGDSPYQSSSSFAGNPLLISPDRLAEDGLLRRDELGGASFPAHEVDYGAVISFKQRLLDRAWANFQSGAAANLRGEFEHFCRERAGWLDEFALFMALKVAHGNGSYHHWPADLVRREPEALTRARRELTPAADRVRFQQFLFFRQWRSLKEHANRQGLRLIGDMPIFVSADSADVWANPGLFLLNAQGRPRVVAGVPPDYFSPTGQVWGNPLYDWEALRRTGYAWWVDRLRGTLAHFDLIRLDHFRGFESAWHVAADAPTAERGQWVHGPGADFFRQVGDALGGLPLLAEDLGLITEPVRTLRDECRLPGMRVLQFAFEGKPENPYLPHNYVPNTVVYTGTHDNDTSRGWYETRPEHERQYLWRYLNRHPASSGDAAWALIRLAWSSVAAFALVPLQDLLNLGGEACMNRPGRAAGNWRWRFTPDAPVEPALQRLRELTEFFNRLPKKD
jgi:4-alpha-glucanotransferase